MTDDYIHLINSNEMDEATMKQINIRGKQILLVNIRGTFYAIDDVCTHAGCYLSEGTLIDERVICPCHKGTFDIRSGEVLDGIPDKPEKSYPIKVQDGKILIKV